MDTAQEAHFIQSFIQRERRARTQFELASPKKRGAFFGRLCHTHENVFDMRYVQPVPKEREDSTMVKTYLIHRQSPKHVYVLSTIDAIDGTFMPIEDALHHIFFHGLPSILVCIPGRLGYFQAEQVVGPPPRYFLER